MTQTKIKLVGGSLALVLASCAPSASSPRWFSSPEPDLGSLKAYVGKLAFHNNCVVMLIEGGLVAANVESARASERVVPLFSSGFSVSGSGDAFTVTTPNGKKLVAGQVVTGDGARYPVVTAKNSRPVAPPPDISGCGTVPFQVKTMFPGKL